MLLEAPQSASRSHTEGFQEQLQGFPGAITVTWSPGANTLPGAVLMLLGATLEVPGEPSLFYQQAQSMTPDSFITIYGTFHSTQNPRLHWPKSGKV